MAMAAVTVTLPDTLDRFVQDQVASGAYPDAQAVLQAGVQKLEAETERERQKMERFLAAVQVGLDQFERGEFVEVTDLKAYLDEIDAEIDAEFATRAA
jgi:putative addiction module CopG family antidote